MTNEQLTVLLRSYLKRLGVILDDIESAFPVEAEAMRADEWWDGERKVSIEERAILSSLTQEKLEYENSYESKPTGRVLVLGKLRGFMSDLSRDISCLSTDARLRVSTHLGAGKGT